MTAVQKTVAKEGDNQGRRFWACPNSEKARCKYFEWDDEDSGGGRPGAGGQGGSQTPGECFKVRWVAFDGVHIIYVPLVRPTGTLD